MSPPRLDPAVRKTGSIQVIVVTGILLWLLLAACRSFVVKIPIDLGNVFSSSARILAASYDDFVFVCLFTAVFAGLAAAASRHAKIRRFITSLYSIGALVTAA